MDDGVGLGAGMSMVEGREGLPATKEGLDWAGSRPARCSRPTGMLGAGTRPRDHVAPAIGVPRPLERVRAARLMAVALLQFDAKLEGRQLAPLPRGRSAARGVQCLVDLDHACASFSTSTRGDPKALRRDENAAARDAQQTPLLRQRQVEVHAPARRPASSGESGEAAEVVDQLCDGLPRPCRAAHANGGADDGRVAGHVVGQGRHEGQLAPSPLHRQGQLLRTRRARSPPPSRGARASADHWRPGRAGPRPPCSWSCSDQFVGSVAPRIWKGTDEGRRCRVSRGRRARPVPRSECERSPRGEGRRRGPRRRRPLRRSAARRPGGPRAARGAGRAASDVVVAEDGVEGVEALERRRQGVRGSVVVADLQAASCRCPASNASWVPRHPVARVPGASRRPKRDPVRPRRRRAS